MDNETGESACHNNDGHVLKGFTGSNVLLLLEGKFERRKATGRRRKMWIDGLLRGTHGKQVP